MSFSKKQLAFIDSLRVVSSISPVSRQDLLRAANLIGQKFPPAWIVKDPLRRCVRGMFLVPEILPSGNALPAVVKASVASVIPQATIKTVAVPPKALQAMSSILGMTGGDRDTLVPPVSREYVPWGHHADIEKIISTGMFAPIFITGLSGNGKTTMVEQICAKMKRACFRVNIVPETDEDDLLGGLRLIDGSTVFQDGPVVNAMLAGAVLLLDEVDLGTEKIMCLQSVLEGKGVYLKKVNRWVVPAPGFTVIATANTKGKGSDDGRFVGTRVMNEAFLDRFDYTYEQAYAPRSTEKKILMKAMKKFGAEDEGFAGMLTQWSEMSRDLFEKNGVDEVISTRRLINICKAYAVFGVKEKAIKMSLARFDAATQKSFYDSYMKLDASVVPPSVEDPADAVATVASDDPRSPFHYNWKPNATLNATVGLAP